MKEKGLIEKQALMGIFMIVGAHYPWPFLLVIALHQDIVCVYR